MREQENYKPLIGDITKQYITSEIEPQVRIIVTAANKLSDTGVILVGARHWDILMRAQFDALAMDKPSPDKIEQGFIDQYGQFLSRADAYFIAHNTGQILIGEDWGELYSENLH